MAKEEVREEQKDEALHDHNDPMIHPSEEFELRKKAQTIVDAHNHMADPDLMKKLGPYLNTASKRHMTGLERLRAKAKIMQAGVTAGENTVQTDDQDRDEGGA